MIDVGGDRHRGDRFGGIYSVSARVLALLMVVVGLAVLTRTLQYGGGPLSVGTLIGLMLLAVGLARLVISLRGSLKAGSSR